VAKFRANARVEAAHAVISRTFGKVAIVDGAWVRSIAPRAKRMPADEEFWLVDVIRDNALGTNRGVLSLVPRYPVEPNEVTRLFPGSFDEFLQDGILYVRPRHAGPLWIASMSLKDLLIKRHDRPHAIIVTIQPPADAAARTAALTS
jgi:hypothetical protein